jgi:hypothetical protein
MRVLIKWLAAAVALFGAGKAVAALRRRKRSDRQTGD